MNQKTLSQLLSRVAALERTSVRHRVGTVTATGPLDVALGGSDVPYENVRQVLPGGAVGDQVSALMLGNDMVVLGRLAPAGLTAYVPTWSSSGTPPSIGNGTLNGYYQRFGDLVFVSIYLTAGSTTAYGTGFYNLSLPVAAVASHGQAIGGVLTEQGVQTYGAWGTIVGGSSFQEILAGSSASGPTNWGTTNPFTLGTDDHLMLSGIYAAA